MIRSNPTVTFHGDARRTNTHRSTTDPGRGSSKQSDIVTKPSSAYLGHLLTENRDGFIIDTAVTAGERVR